MCHLRIVRRLILIVSVVVVILHRNWVSRLKQFATWRHPYIMILSFEPDDLPVNTHFGLRFTTPEIVTDDVFRWLLLPHEHIINLLLNCIWLPFISERVPTEDACSSRHLVQSHMRLAYVLMLRPVSPKLEMLFLRQEIRTFLVTSN